MKQFTIALVGASSLANTVMAFVESPYFSDWDSSAPACWAERPRTCTGNDSTDGNCASGTVCSDNDCIPVRQYWCFNNCGEGESLRPDWFCMCDSDSNIESMFCDPAPEPEPEQEEEGADEEASGEEENQEEESGETGDGGEGGEDEDGAEGEDAEPAVIETTGKPFAGSDLN